MNILEKFREINTFILDVDGVLTDGSIHITEDGKLLRRMHSHDGYALRQAISKGYRIIVITGGKEESVRTRLSEIGIGEIFLDASDKEEIIEDLVRFHDLDLGASMYMGDDLNDYDVMKLVHLPVCPSNAVSDIVDLSQYVSPKKGGTGAVRDVIEKVMKLRGDWTVGPGLQLD